jgi:hypothetical protein
MFRRFRMNKEDGGSARAAARGRVDDLKALFLHVVKSGLNVGYPKGDVCESAASAVLFKLPGHGTFGAQGLEQLDGIRTVADSQQHFAYLVAAEHVFAMQFREAEVPISLYLQFQFARLHSDGDVIEAQESGDLGGLHFGAILPRRLTWTGFGDSPKFQQQRVETRFELRDPRFQFLWRSPPGSTQIRKQGRDLALLLPEQ